MMLKRPGAKRPSVGEMRGKGGGVCRTPSSGHRKKPVRRDAARMVARGAYALLASLVVDPLVGGAALAADDGLALHSFERAAIFDQAVGHHVSGLRAVGRGDLLVEHQGIALPVNLHVGGVL